MSLIFGLSPLLVVALGAVLLMLSEAFGRPKIEPGVATMDAGAGRTDELGLGAAVALFAGAVMSVAVSMVGPEKLEGIDKVAPYLVIDRFTLYLSNLLPTLDSAVDTTSVFFGTKAALTFAAQFTKMETLRSERSFSNLLRGLQVYGFRVVNGVAMGRAVVARG